MNHVKVIFWFIYIFILPAGSNQRNCLHHSSQHESCRLALMLVSVTDVCSLWLSEHRQFGRRCITFLAVVPTQLASLCVTCIYHVSPPPPPGRLPSFLITNAGQNQFTKQGCLNFVGNVDQVTKFCRVACNVCGSSVRNFLNVVLKAHRILRCFLGFWKKNCVPLVKNVYVGSFFHHVAEYCCRHRKKQCCS